MAPVSAKDVDQHEVVRRFAKFLKDRGDIEAPDWVDVVKTGTFKELGPADPDWYYIRCAAIARHLYVRAPCGINGFGTIFGGRKRNGVRPKHFCKASTGVIRKALQSLTKVNLVELDKETGGRRLTDQGKRDLDHIAYQIKYNRRPGGVAAKKQ